MFENLFNLNKISFDLIPFSRSRYVIHCLVPKQMKKAIFHILMINILILYN